MIDPDKPFFTREDVQQWTARIPVIEAEMKTLKSEWELLHRKLRAVAILMGKDFK